MVIRTSSAREVERLVGQLRDGGPVEREAAIARLRVIGARAIDRLVRLIASEAGAAARAAALKALEGSDDARGRAIAVESLDADTPAVATAAIGVLRTHLASDPAVLDAITAVALDRTRAKSIRLAALDALSELPRATIQPVLQQVGGDDPVLADATAEGARMALDDPAGLRQWLSLRGAAAPLSEIHDAIARIRERERDEPSARRRQEWQAARGEAHLVLAKRGSRVALYDLREAFDSSTAPLPIDFISAMTAIGDASCLEPLARAWATAAREPWWRARVAEAAQVIAGRTKLTARSAIGRRIRTKYPGFL